MKKALPLLLLTISLSTSAFEISLGPKVQDRVVFIQTTTEGERVVEIVQVLDSKTVEIWYQDAKGNIFVDKTDLKGCKMVRPDVAKVNKLDAPRCVINVTVKVLREDGKQDKLNVGGWYLVKPEAGK